MAVTTPQDFYVDRDDPGYRRDRTQAVVRGAFARAAAEKTTPYSVAVRDYIAGKQGVSPGIGSPDECACWLRPHVTAGRLLSDPALAAVIALASPAELAALRADPLTANKLDQFNVQGD